MRLHSDQESREIDLFHLNGFESYYKFTREKMIQSVNFVPNRYEKSFKMAYPTRKKTKEF